MGGILTGLVGSYVSSIGDYESIATITVGVGGAAFIEFTSIPQTYKHLQLRGIVRASYAATADNFGIYVNGNNTSTNYTKHFLQGNGSAASAGGATTNQWFGLMPAANATANCFGTAVIDILDYTSTNKYKTMRQLWGYDTNSTNGYAGLSSSIYFGNTNAITSIRVVTGVNLVQYSSFALYGIK
jgi:hypothetical protein